MISKNKLKKIIEDAESKGHKLKVRDVAYAYLCTHFEDSAIAYKVVYGEDVLDTAAFDSKPAIAYIKDQIKYSLVTDASESADKMSFDENKKEMIKLIKRTEEGMAEGRIDEDKGLNIIKDIRVKLNDKFNVSDKSKSGIVIVEPKYTNVCSCGREICIPTREQLMAQYGLVEKE